MIEELPRKYECDVCRDSKPISDFVFCEKCNHGQCSNCRTELGETATCPWCRAELPTFNRNTIQVEELLDKFRCRSCGYMWRVYHRVNNDPEERISYVIDGGLYCDHCTKYCCSPRHNTYNVRPPMFVKVYPISPYRNWVQNKLEGTRAMCDDCIMRLESLELSIDYMLRVLMLNSVSKKESLFRRHLIKAGYKETIHPPVNVTVCRRQLDGGRW
jgi:hypothetical protein